MDPDLALVKAIEDGIPADVVDAIQRGGNVNARDWKGRSLLEMCEERGANDIARILLRKGADCSGRAGASNNSLLHRAAARGNLGFAVVLVEAGMDVGIRNSQSLTPLHLAARRGDEYFARFLIEHGADINAVARNGDTPLRIAKRRNDHVFARLLESYGARDDGPARKLAGQFPAQPSSSDSSESAVAETTDDDFHSGNVRRSRNNRPAKNR